MKTFQERMRELNAFGTTNKAKMAAALIISKEIETDLLRIYRATGLQPSRTISELLETTAYLLKEIADEFEKKASKEILSIPLKAPRRGRRSVPAIRSIESFVKEKKK
jgi:hypothetical protein